MTIDPHAAFDQAFAARALHLSCRAETPNDAHFLTQLFVACSPFAAMLPVAMLKGQAYSKEATYRRARPGAMHRIVLSGDRPIGRIIIDWDSPAIHCVDVALLPEFQGAGVGSRLLGAWLDIGDRLAKPAGLKVVPGNPAIRLYARLGFVPGDAADQPVITMTRPPRAGMAEG